VVRSGHRGSPKELAQSLFQYLPLGLFLSAFVPGLAAMILAFTASAAQVTASILGQSVGKVITDIGGFGSLTADNFFGGAIGGLLLFALLAFGALVLWLGMQIHQYGIPLSVLVAALSLAMLVHPKYRRKALAPIYVFLGLAFSVPLLFLLLAVIFGVMRADWGSSGGSAIGSASEVLFVALGLILAALAPWALLKYAPILPTKADSEDFGSTGPGIGSEIIGQAGNYAMYGRRGGGDGGGVGGDQPSTRSDNMSSPSSSAGVGGQQGEAPGPMQAAYQQRSDLAGAGEHGGGQVVGGKPAMAGAGESAGAGRAGGAAAGAGEAGGAAAAGAATGGAALGVAVAAQAASTAITKAKAAADTAAPEADSN
jgi:hypothetical protein